MWRGVAKCGWSLVAVLGVAAACGGRAELLSGAGPGGSGSSNGGVGAGGASGAGATAGAPSPGGALGVAGVSGLGPSAGGGASGGAGSGGDLGESGAGGDIGEGGVGGAAGAPGADDCGGDCPNGLACVAGACATECLDDSGCRSDHFCENSKCLLEAVQVAAGGRSSCARLVDGSVRCWGDNQGGQLGNGTTANSDQPVVVSGLPDGSARARSLSMGMAFACSALTDGTARCWGRNNGGELGNGSLVSESVPTRVRHFDIQNPVLYVSAGSSFACGLTLSGAVQCWGSNQRGQLGNGTTIGSLEPSSAVLGTPDSSVGTSIQLGAGEQHTCMMLGSTRLRCWGANYHGQLGSTSVSDSSNPVDAVITAEPPRLGLGMLAVGRDHTCVSNGPRTRCWGYDSETSLAVPTDIAMPAGTSVQRIAAGGKHTCVVLDDQRVFCWGGAEPIGNPTPSAVPVQIAGLPPNQAVVGLSAGLAHTCALLGNGAVYCWGENIYGQLGVPNLGTPVLLSSATALRVQPW